MAARIGAVGPETDIADDLEAFGLGRHNEHRRAAVWGRARIGRGHHDHEFGMVGVRREPFVAGDYPVVAIPHRHAAQIGGVRSALRLGHREGREDVAVQQRLEILRLLFLGTEHGEDLAIARVRPLAAEHHRPECRGAEHLVHISELDRAAAATAQMLGQMRRPHAVILHLLLEALDHLAQRQILDVVGSVLVIVIDEFERADLVLDKVLHPIELLLELGVDSEIHGFSPDGVARQPAARARVSASVSRPRTSPSKRTPFSGGARPMAASATLYSMMHAIRYLARI